MPAIGVDERGGFSEFTISVACSEGEIQQVLLLCLDLQEILASMLEV